MSGSFIYLCSKLSGAGTFSIFCMDDCLSGGLFLRLMNEESFKGNSENILHLAMKKNY